MTSTQLATVPGLLPALEDIYRDFHANPELSKQEKRTAGIVAAQMRDLGYDVTENVGGYGVVAVLTNGEGPTVWLRADMDGLPVAEQTGLAYASTATATHANGDTVPVMHACGHDMHTTCLLGAARVFAATKDEWSGTLVTVFQPDEETLHGSAAMLDDGILDRFPRPEVVLGQHVGPLPAGAIFYRPGPIMAAADNFEITFFGAGGHGSMPHTSIDPVVMAASAVMRLQTIVSREVAPNDSVVLTVGSIDAGFNDNIIPDEAILKLTLRTFDLEVRDKAIASIERIARAEALASNAPKAPEITVTTSGPTTLSDEVATQRVTSDFRSTLGEGRVVLLPVPAPGSEDVGRFGFAADVPSVFWFLGGAEASRFAPPADPLKVMAKLPSNHSPMYAPEIEPTLQTGIEALVIAGMSWLGSAS
ncbi:MAG: amidohydrolase [Actinobacteria bacterium]|nr:amidohydrolase [Actinomycetota bacterium]